jgi:hypothetical protein
MHKINIDIDGLIVPVRMLYNEAPITCQRLLETLPFKDKFTHAIWSGLMIHTNIHPKLELDVSKYPLIENPVGFIAPGDVFVWPHNGLIGIAYGSTEFRWLTGPLVVTKIGVIENGIEDFASKAGRMMWKGATSITIQKSKVMPTPVNIKSTKFGKLVTIDFDGVKFIAELFEDKTSDYCNALWEALPLEGPTTITHSSGEVLHFWVNIPVPEKAPKEIQSIVPVQYEGKKVGVTSVAYDPLSMRGQHPGDIIWGSTWNGIRIVYGQGRFGGLGGSVSVSNRPKLGRIIQGSLEEFKKSASRIPHDGSKRMTISRFNG